MTLRIVGALKGCVKGKVRTYAGSYASLMAGQLGFARLDGSGGWGLVRLVGPDAAVAAFAVWAYAKATRPTGPPG